jgi:hypothetical protein
VDKNMPQFDKQFYSDTVPENIELHSPLSVSIQATSPMSRKLIYSIVKGNELEEFAVDFNTGMLQVFTMYSSSSYLIYFYLFIYFFLCCSSMSQHCRWILVLLIQDFSAIVIVIVHVSHWKNERLSRYYQRLLWHLPPPYCSFS